MLWNAKNNVLKSKPFLLNYKQFKFCPALLIVTFKKYVYIGEYNGLQFNIVLRII